MNVSTEAALARYCALFAALRPGDLVRFPDYYTADARFKDPFNAVRGVSAVQAVFAHMFAVTERPHFEILEQSVAGATGFVRWQFHFAPRGQPETDRLIEGVSRIVFASDGRVSEHVDYWDPAEAIYADLPVLGPLLRLLRRRLSAGANNIPV